MFFIQSFKSNDYQEITNEIGYTEKSIQGYRGRIFDRKGEVLAETINKYTFWVNTQKIFDHRAKMNSLSASGRWTENSEHL